MVRPEGVEPPTYWFVASCSIQLSYGRTLQGCNKDRIPDVKVEGNRGRCEEEMWCARKDSNLRPFGSKPNALSS